ncbi:putative F-box/LRR-repeat protein 23 [Lotus japonicus]|uniref:putative F-box/LRR-repeat protein 23 n=1 Tax=Lotus japonicus TaxID=34305 RepID=UPI00258BB0C2|nr:putative F-box/LRR-repeat protein 23 [Lotus japonicus]
MMASKEVEGVNTNGPNWLELPRDVTTNILLRLGVVEIVMSASQVCSLWWNICKDPLMWHIIDMTNLLPLTAGRRTSPFDMTHHPDYSTYKLEKICRWAIKRSGGHLEDIGIESYVATDNLLKDIVSSTSHLRRLRLSYCWSISEKALIEVVKRLPLLEELDISFTIQPKYFLEAIGRCCPLLKSLKMNTSLVVIPRYVHVNCSDDKAFVIAETMPELRHLQIMGNSLSNDGLLAILDGCPLLEYLDLRGCPFVDLSGSLEKRCHEQIKYLRLPTDIEDTISDDYPLTDTRSSLVTLF